MFFPVFQLSDLVVDGINLSRQHALCFTDTPVDNEFSDLLCGKSKSQHFTDENNAPEVFYRIAAIVILRIAERVKDSYFFVVADRIHTDVEKFR